MQYLTCPTSTGRLRLHEQLLEVRTQVNLAARFAALMTKFHMNRCILEDTRRDSPYWYKSICLTEWLSRVLFLQTYDTFPIWFCIQGNHKAVGKFSGTNFNFPSLTYHQAGEPKIAIREPEIDRSIISLALANLCLSMLQGMWPGVSAGERWALAPAAGCLSP